MCVTPSSNSPTLAATIIQFIPPFITLLGVAVALYGLWMNNLLASHREVRKERRAKIDAVVKMLDELGETAISFNQSDEFSADKYWNLVRAIARVKGRIDHLGFSFEEKLHELYADMRVAMLTNGSEEGEFTKLDGDDPLIDTMAISKEMVVWRIEERFEEEFAIEVTGAMRRFGGYKSAKKKKTPPPT